MRDPDEIDHLRRWVEIMNKTHGYGDVFNHQTADDKAIVELNTAREWRKSVAAEYGLTVGEPESNPDDPPDCHVFVEGKHLGVELVQLVEPKHKNRAAKNETPYAGQLFVDMQWTKQRLVSELNSIIQMKGRKYEDNGKWIQVLLIHTAEPWLSPFQAQEWLTDAQLESHSHIESAFLLFGYDPAWAEGRYWPVFWLYGNLSETR